MDDENIIQNFGMPAIIIGSMLIGVAIAKVVMDALEAKEMRKLQEKKERIIARRIQNNYLQRLD